MYLHKAAVNAPAVKTAPEPSVKNVPSKTPPAQTAKTSAPSLPPVPHSVSSLISSSGLPADKLSASIISFARFFSLPIKPELMAAIRRQALAQSTTTAQSDLLKHTAGETSGSGATIKSREAFSLAAAAAESKGVELNPKGLEMFAEAIDPDQGRQDSGDQNQRKRRNRKHNESEEENASLKTGTISASGIEEMALESAERNTLLRVLNRMPGKNGQPRGQRWIVLPFNFSENGREFRVSMRILLETENASNRAVCMALDIAESGKTFSLKTESIKTESFNIEHPIPEKRWLFVLEWSNSQVSKLSVYLQPELPPRTQSSFISELSALLEIPQKQVSVKKWTESFPCESGGADQMRSVDEAV